MRLMQMNSDQHDIWMRVSSDTNITSIRDTGMYRSAAAGYSSDTRSVGDSLRSVSIRSSWPRWRGVGGVAICRTVGYK